jgi:outer membrane protein assembly factor BamE (lipoprotein component of BamABCDE complex)
MKPLAIALLLVAFCAGGCASNSQGKKFDDSYVTQIKKGATTKAEVREHLGEPQSITKTSDMETWTYRYSDAYGRAYIQAATFGLVREKSDDQMLMVVFKDDIVMEYNYTK